MSNLKLAVALLAILVCCADIPTGVHPSSDFVDLDSAIDFGWNCLGRADMPPTVLVLTGSALTCGPDIMGANQGWYADINTGRKCVSGLTVTPSLCYVAHWGLAWHAEAVEHELLHAAQYRMGWIDNNHTGPDWQPGGLLDMCTMKMADNGY